MKNWLVLITLLLTPTMALANNVVDPLLWGCSEIDDDDKRLSCFDAYIKQKSALQSKPAKDPQPLVLNSNGDHTQNTAKPLPQPAPESDVKQQFGLEHKKTEEEKKVTKITSTLTSATKKAHNKWSFTLDNGQKWRTIEATTTSFKVGQSVVIERGMFNSFSLKKTGSNRTVKVKRIQ
ncbi:hypothetical protein [Thalassotalea litorea]|uniref:hypothetical protein n=1 Tax=Thalassotalea litorea TaxID=2020715 RepID=UPI00373544A2